MEAAQRAKGLEALIEQARGNALALAALARLLRTEGDKSRSAELAFEALDLAPENGEARAIAREVLSGDVPVWHFTLVRDEARNAAYEEALRRVVTPTSRVFEIGTGTGLLAMMAARLGAAHVYTCEMEPAVAMAARRVIAANGLSDKITVLSRHSKDVQPSDLGGLADVFVSEIVSNDMVTEDALPWVEDAIARLVKPGGAIIPARGRIRVAFGQDSGERFRSAETASGFDLTAFDPLVRPYYGLPIGNSGLTLCSEPADLFTFDFSSGGPWPEARARIETTVSGPVNAIVQWIALDMDSAGLYENRPQAGGSSAWAAHVHPLGGTVEARPGARGWIAGRHDRATLRLWGGVTP